MKYLVATDLDGTLLRADGTVSERTRAALRSAGESGVEVVYATGRPPRWLQRVYDETGYRPLTICANGALTLRADEVVAVNGIEQADVDEVSALLRSHRSDFVFRTEQWRGHTLKLLAGLPDVEQKHADEVLSAVRDLAGHLVEPTHSAFGQLLIEMGPAGVTKAAALRRLHAEHWPDRTSIAIGDMPNDVAMLRAVDIPMTVETGHAAVREVARVVLPGPEHDGVATLLERLVVGGDPVDM